VALVRDFDRDAVIYRKHITEFLQSEPEVFYLTAIEILNRDLDSRAAQYLVVLLLHGNLLFRALCDPVLDRERATALARQAHRGDPSIDVKLARQLADSDPAGSGLGPGMAERLLEIVDHISDGRRILPSLMRMLRIDNPFLRSKVVLMIGRSGRSVTWLEKRLKEADTRVRANAIEAMWGIDTKEARELLQWAARDTNNRVVGNALVGLYRLGEISPLAELIEMAGHDSATFRRTATWVMGSTGDPRFSEVLGHMIADSNADVRKSAFEAVRRVREAVAQISQTTEWPVAVATGPRNPRTGERRVSVAVTTADGRGSPAVLPAQFVLSENGQPVWSYRVAEKMVPGPMSVVFLFPRKLDNTGKPWDQGALRCLHWKRSTDLWSMLPYSGTDDAPSERPADLELPTFIANSAQAARSFQETPKRLDCTGFWTAVQRAVMPGNAPQRGRRHMIVLAPDEVGNANDSLISAVQASRTSMLVLSTSVNPVLREFCRRVDGRFLYVKDSSAIEEAVSLAYLSLLARYDIRYRSDTPDATSLKLRVHTPDGWGETTVDL
jgi:hypothetical protein